MWKLIPFRIYVFELYTCEQGVSQNYALNSAVAWYTVSVVAAVVAVAAASVYRSHSPTSADDAFQK
jgi:uncharacterized membrane protein (GlpM family)